MKVIISCLFKCTRLEPLHCWIDELILGDKYIIQVSRKLFLQVLDSWFYFVLFLMARKFKTQLITTCFVFHHFGHFLLHIIEWVLKSSNKMKKMQATNKAKPDWVQLDCFYSNYCMLHNMSVVAHWWRHVSQLRLGRLHFIDSWVAALERVYLKTWVSFLGQGDATQNVPVQWMLL